ncbi:unnamed protein product [Phytophthora fragariaefolia]|uniref:Unnamed protein product n=1 Tax=Phytophthora fragariaefolia TaxID=1490495 RepID=A0A9W7CVV6_9STRA|nr:unnamed protein product [Phytophthora fragariaefolia]
MPTEDAPQIESYIVEELENCNVVDGEVGSDDDIKNESDSDDERVTSGSAIQDAHQVSKSGGQATAPERADVSMSADSKLGPDDEDKSVSDASAQASVGGADVVEYVDTKKPPFGPVDDVEVVEVGSDPDDINDEVQLVKVEPAAKKEAYISTVQGDLVLEDMEVSSLKSSGTASARTSAQARLSPILTAEVQVKTYVADQVRRWERDVSDRSFPPKHQTQLFKTGFGFLNLVPGWFRTRANKADPDLVHNVVEEMLILLTIEMVELRQLVAQAARVQVSARTEQPCSERDVLELDVEMSDREVELLGCDYVRCSGYPDSRS